MFHRIPLSISPLHSPCISSFTSHSHELYIEGKIDHPDELYQTPSARHQKYNIQLKCTLQCQNNNKIFPLQSSQISTLCSSTAKSNTSSSSLLSLECASLFQINNSTHIHMLYLVLSFETLYCDDVMSLQKNPLIHIQCNPTHPHLITQHENLKPLINSISNKADKQLCDMTVPLIFADSAQCDISIRLYRKGIYRINIAQVNTVYCYGDECKEPMIQYDQNNPLWCASKATQKLTPYIVAIHERSTNR